MPPRAGNASRRNAASAKTVGNFGGIAVSLSKSPLGIIALFIVLVYAVAGLVLGIGGRGLSDPQRAPLVWFLVLFPLLVFVGFCWLVVKHHLKLYGPSDFANEELFLQLQATQRRVDVLAELNPGIALPPLAQIDDATAKPALRSSTQPGDADDPQRGMWGGHREANFRKLAVGRVTALKADPSNYRVPLTIVSTDPAGHPLSGKVRFYLHDTFDPDVEEVEARGGVAKLTVVAYGAFTVGAETDDGARLELNLADPDVDAPKAFKDE